MTGARALRIGGIELHPPIVLAPMAGVTNAAFRRLCASYGPALYVSEMITARALVERNPKTLRMAARAEGTKVHSVQLYGVDPAVVGDAVGMVVGELGADHVDLNFGCPAEKVTRRGGGAALPAHPALFARIVAAARRSADSAGGAPVTVKMRIGIDEATETALSAGRIAEAEGADAVTLHARTAEQRYSGSARWEAIAALKAAIGSIPVLGNGDVWDAADALAMQERTGCDGVVVGRGCLGRPWIFGAFSALYGDPACEGRQSPLDEHRLGDVAAVMALHARLLADLLGEAAAVRDFRKHLGWYLTGFPVGPEPRRRLAAATTLFALGSVLDELDGEAARPPGWQRRPRGHTDGPRPVTLPERWLETCDDPRPPAGGHVAVSGG